MLFVIKMVHEPAANVRETHSPRNAKNAKLRRISDARPEQKSIRFTDIHLKLALEWFTASFISVFDYFNFLFACLLVCLLACLSVYLP